MSDLITDEIFTDGQKNIAALNMNGIIGRAHVQPDVIANKVASATLDIADQMLVLKTDNTLARARFDVLVNSTSSALPIADTTKNGMLRQISGKTTDVVDGTNHCVPISSFLPPGVVVDFAGPNIPAGWLYCDGTSKLRATYPDLFTAIGSTYGSVDGTHFNVPNYQGRILAGAGGSFGALAAAGGAPTVALAVGHLPAHAHSITDVTHQHATFAHTHTDSGHTHTYNVVGGSGSIGSGVGFTLVAGTTNAGFANLSSSSPNTDLRGTGLSTTNNTGSGTAFAILPPFQTTYKIIKT